MNYSQLRMANIRKWFSSDQAPLGGLQYDFKFVDAFICHNLDWDLSLKLQTFFKQNKFNIYWPWSTPGIQHIQVNTERRISCSHVLHYERGTRLSAGAAAGLAVPYIISKWKMRKAMRGSKRLGLIGQFTYLRKGITKRIIISTGTCFDGTGTVIAGVNIVPLRSRGRSRDSAVIEITETWFSIPWSRVIRKPD